MKSVLLRRLRSSGAYGVVVESDAISDALATRAGIAIKPWKYATTLFTDTAGTVAASAAGDIIAVAKDDSRALVLGSEKVVNGSFATDTDWTKLNTTISGGTANFSAVAAVSLLIQAMAFNTSKIYKVTFTISNYVSGTINIVFGVGTNVTVGSVSASGDYTFYSPSGAGNVELRVTCNGGGATASMDNLSVVETNIAQYQQTTLANRPILTKWPKTGRRNRLTWTEDFSNAVWVKVGTTGSALQIRETAVSSDHTISQLVSLSGDVTAVFELETVGRNIVRVNLGTSSGTYGVLYNFTTNAFTSVGTAITSTAFTDLGDGYHRLTIKSNAGANRFTIQPTDAGVSIYLGDVTKGINARNLCLETGTVANTYQKVTSAYDITEAGQADCWGLTFDGTNDGMATAATLDLSGSDKVAVFTGVTKTQAAATALIVEHSATLDANAGTIAIYDRNSATYAAQSKGVTASGLAFASGTYTPTISNVVTGIGDISADLTTIRTNGASAGTATGDQGAGNFGNYTNYIGARGGSSLYFNGILWGAAIVSTLTTADATEITAIEAQIADNTPTVTL